MEIVPVSTTSGKANGTPQMLKDDQQQIVTTLSWAYGISEAFNLQILLE